MKKIKTTLLATILAFSSIVGYSPMAFAQTAPSTPPAPGAIILPGAPGTPPIDTSSNALSFTNITVELYTGYAYVSGQTSSSQAKTGLYYDILNGFGPSVEIANEASGNVIADMDAYFEYHRKAGSIEPLIGLGLGYNWDDRAPEMKLKAGFNYNLTRVGSYFPFVGVQAVLGYEINNSKSQRPSMGGFVTAGIGL